MDMAQQQTVGGLPLSEDWLRDAGFKWHQLDRQPDKHWLLWIGDASDQPWSGPEDLGIELARGAYNGTDDTDWFCWLRCDSSHRYHRFLHVRHLKFVHEVIAIIEALTGQTWKPENVWYGSLRSEKASTYLRKERDRLDKRIHQEQCPWSESEKDSTRGKPLREHLDAAIKSGLSK